MPRICLAFLAFSAIIDLASGQSIRVSAGSGGFSEPSDRRGAIAQVKSPGHHAVRLDSRQVTRAPVPNDICAEAIPETKFLTTDKEVYIRFSTSAGEVGDRVIIEWVNPRKEVYVSQPFVNATINACSAWYVSIAGYPPATQTGQWSVRVKWNDAILFEELFEIANPAPSAITVPSNGALPLATVGAAYDYSLAASGGREPYAWSLVSGSLPAGLSISASGRVSGTPVAAGSSQFSLKVMDAAGSSATRTFTLGVASPDIAITPRSLLFSQLADGTRPGPQTISLASTGAPVNYSASVEGASWLTIGSQGGTTPGSISVSVNPSGLGTGSYSGAIRIRSTALNIDRTLPVRLTIEDPGRPSITRGLISTAAGNDWLFPSRGRAQAAPLSKEVFLATDTAGNIYGADTLNHVVFRISPDGAFETIAGNSVAGFSGDGGLAVNASLNSPCGIALDSTGNIFVGDRRNNRIRRISASGIISTYAGTGRAAFAGDDGPALSAPLNGPCQIAVDASGSLYFYDDGNDRIRRVSPDGRITTIAGNGTTTWNADGPALESGIGAVNGLAVSAEGTVYFSSFVNGRIRRIRGGRMEVFAGNGQAKTDGDGGPALNASFKNPEGLSVTSNGELLVCDLNGHRIRRIDRNGIITTIAGTVYGLGGDNGPATKALFRFPFSVASDNSGNVYVADNGALTIRKIDASGTILSFAGNGLFRQVPEGTAATSSYLFFPRGIAFDKGGNLYIADSDNEFVRRITPSGISETIAGIGSDGCCLDNGPARLALLSRPSGVAVDNAGNLYISDSSNFRIRRVDTKGIITTWAGDGENRFGGDGGPAAGASFSYPQGIVIDAGGSLLVADLRNYRIRKIAADGKVTTVAGNGKAEFSGDSGQAVAAGLQEPWSVAVDSKGNIYVADGIGHRVRRISVAGVISTFTGNGTGSSTGDSGPASAATVNYPTGVTVDATDNVYISEYDGNRVRRVDAITGSITTVAGTGAYDFSGDGGLGANASLRSPFVGLAIDPSGSLFISDTDNHRIRSVKTAVVTIQAAPDAVSFSTGLTANIQLTSSFPGLPFSATAQFESGGEWLELSAGNGSFPSALTLTASRAGLAAGTYKATVVIAAPNSQPSQLRIAVTLLVAATEPPRLKIESGPLSFSFLEGAGPATQQIRITNPSSIPLTVAVNATGGPWLAIDSQGGRVTASEPLNVTLTVDPARLSAGTFKGSITAFATGAGNLVLADQLDVVATVTRQQRIILLSQTGLTFRAIAGGGAPLPHSVSILNTGTGAMNWTATVGTLSGGSWLKIGNPSGTVQTPYLDTSELGISADISGLQPGEYYARIDIKAPGADNSPQTITAILNVLAAGTALGPEVRPTGVVFVGGPGLLPGSKKILVGNTSLSSIAYVSNSQTFDGNTWLSHAPARANVASGQPTEVQLLPNLASLNPGIRNGAVSLLFEDGSTQDIKVTSVVSATPVDPKNGRSAAGCNGSKLKLVSTSLSQNVIASVGQPVPVEVMVVDENGPLTKDRCNASVKLDIVHENASVKLDSLPDGRWTKSWTPRRSTASERVTAYVTAFAVGTNGKIIADQFPVTLQVGSGGQTPRIASGGVVNAASSTPNAPLAPGMLISVYGNNLGTGAGTTAQTVPVPTELAGTEVRLGDRALPLAYASDGQVNAQVPYDLPPNTVHQLLVRRSGTLSSPEAITVASVQPAVFTTNQQGTGQGIITNGVTNLLANSDNPLRAGNVMVIYCTGLGLVNPAVQEGRAAPSNPLSRTVNPVTVSIGGTSAAINFAGLAPNFAGLYQVNAVVPVGVQPGPQVPVVLSIGGQASPTVTVAIE
ncbi:MAG: putative Ig domain-containing protein [Bryobacteraceae bacterium]|nr:putative Ig domain-containing protein [Bryobacteraceae bacterium]